ncbi:MAG: DUF21 domain-containing protein [Verrucomicrobiales bacterium]|nr:DUF21 domain-containing protein [Verrucomicrobiales bacterium]
MIWLGVLILLLISLVLSGCEAALLSVSRVRVRHAAAEGDPAALRLLPLLEDRDALLGAVTVANHVTNLVAFAVAAWHLVGVWGHWGYAVAFVLGLPVFLVLLEVLPKKLARRFPFRTLRRAEPLLRVVGVLRFLFRGILPDVKSEQEERETEALVRRDLQTLALRLADLGIMSEDAAAWIDRVLGYRALKVGQLMTPLRRSVALAPDLPAVMGLELARAEGVAALPVLTEDGRFAGVFEPERCGNLVPEDRLVRQYMRPLDQVVTTDSALRCLQRLRKRGRNVALVMNAQGEPAGLISEQALLQPLMVGAAPA